VAPVTRATTRSSSTVSRQPPEHAIHEGTNGIQALDLLGRKVLLEQGALLTELVETMGRTLVAATATGDGQLAGQAAHLRAVTERVGKVPRAGCGRTAMRRQRWLMQRPTCKRSATWCWPGSGSSWVWPRMPIAIAGRHRPRCGAQYRTLVLCS
jgi:hypothetical protein